MQKLSLQQRLQQKLSPQQIQVIKLLEIPAMQLEARIKKELEENPVLEIEKNESSEEEEYDNELKTNEDKDDEEFSVDDYLNEEDYPSYKYTASNYSADDKENDMPYSSGSSFHEFLEEQVGLLNLDETQMVLAEQIIGNIDEDGYLRREIESICDDLAFMANVETTDSELTNILHRIQELDPPGVGARNLRECLRLQLDRKDQTNPSVALATQIIRDAFDEFTRKHYDKLERKFAVSSDELRDAIDEVLKLNPKPGSSYSSTAQRINHTIIPDFLLEVSNGELLLTLNQKNVPDLFVSAHYSNMLKGYQDSKGKMSASDKNAVLFVKQKLDSAKWFIDAIRQRQQTLMLVMSEILDYQKEYFLDGDETKLRPMILKDIADKIDMDISTISRVSNSKFIQTHFGIYSLKSFFSESMQKEGGEEVSTREIKSILQDCIDNEDKKKPLTDEKLAAILKEKSYPIARRTVAKYREQLGVPVARMRKEL